MKIKLAIIQRICPHYRVPLFRKLAELFDLTVFISKGTTHGASKNAERLEGFRCKILPTIAVYLKFRNKELFMPFLPTALHELKKGDFDVVITEGSSNLLTNLLLYGFKTHLNAPLIFWDAGRHEGKPMGLGRKLVEPLIRAMLLKSDACLAYGETARNYFVNVGVAEEKIFVAQNTICIEEIEKEKNTVKKEELDDIKQRLKLYNKKVILYAGALEKRKKIDFLLRVFKSLQRDDVALLILGDGPDMSRLKKISAELGLSNKVYFLGRRVKDRAPFFMIADLYVIPSEYGFVNIALAYGKPVVVNKFIAEAELVQDGINGYICEPNDIKCYNEKILRLLDDPSLRKSFGQKGLEIIKEKANMDYMINRIVQAVNYCIKHRR